MKAPMGYSGLVEKSDWNSPDTLFSAEDTKFPGPTLIALAQAI